MNHLKEIILERRNFKDYKKYIEPFYDKYYHDFLNKIDKIAIYEENGDICIELIVWNEIYRYFIEEINNDNGIKIEYSIHSQNNNQLRIVFEHITGEFLDNLELEYKTKKYKL